MFGRKEPSAPTVAVGPEGLTPEEEDAIAVGLDRVAHEKRDALRDPGPSWKVWFLQDAAKWWMFLLYLIFDVWIAGFWLEEGSTVFIGPSLVGATYAEFLLYRYLWYQPNPDRTSRHGFRRTWFRPVRFGRWTSEGAKARSGVPVDPSAGSGPDPGEFL